MCRIFQDFLKRWVTFWGRRNPAVAFQFPENQIIMPGSDIKISFLTGAIFFNLHPTLYAVLTSPEGERHNLKGGYIQLHPGRYTLHFVDKRERIDLLPKVSDTTLDGATVSLVVNINYRVQDPIRALDIQYPVETLFSTIHSDIREYIRTSRHDEIVGASDDVEIDSDRMFKYIKQQLNRHHQISRSFVITDLVVREKEGDSKLLEIRKNLQIQRQQNVVDSQLLMQNQELERKVASQDAEIKKIKAQAELGQQEILQKLRLREIDLDGARNDLQWRQDKWSHAMDAITQTLSIPSPRSQREMDIIQELLNELGELSVRGKHEGVDNQKHMPDEMTMKKSNEKIDTLTNTLLNLLDRKKSRK